MGALEITLIVVGLLIIAASYYISENMNQPESSVVELQTVEDYEARMNVEKDMKMKLQKMSEQIIMEAEANLCKLSNEKIMAVNEYGDMVIDKIDKTHSEVVFLYSMLNDKESELKELAVKKMDSDQLEDEMVDTLVEDSKVALEFSQAKVLHENKPKAEATDELEYDERHEQILSLLKKGKSVREISKDLGMGQGEVQLIVNLHTGGK